MGNYWIRLHQVLVFVLIVGGVGLNWACASHSGRRGGWPSDRVQTLPKKVRKAYRVFAVRCSRCHTLARPLNSGIDDPVLWRRYVTRMRRMPGSGISVSDSTKILVFLNYYAHQLRKEQSDAMLLEP